MRGCKLTPGTCPCGLPALKGQRCCSQACRRAWAEEHVWSVARTVALVRAEWRCRDCGASDWDGPLEVHHLVPVDRLTGYREGCQHHQANLAVLCPACHQRRHLALRAPLGAQLLLFRAA